MKNLLLIFALAVGFVSFAYLAFMFLVSSSISSSSIETWEQMQKANFQCPPGTEVTYRPWSENGRQRYCEQAKDGRWEAWMSGYKQVEGSYVKGKEHGTWRWFNSSGEVTKTIEYSNGEEITPNKPINRTENTSVQN